MIPMARHFLGCLRTAQYAATHGCSIKLNDDQRANLTLWKKFLDKARDGISFNLLSYCTLTHISRSDACTHGIGSASLMAEAGWRFEIPLHLWHRATLNCLEFLAVYCKTWMLIHVWKADRGSCFLSHGDSTTSAGWIQKSNFKNVHWG